MRHNSSWTSGLQTTIIRVAGTTTFVLICCCSNRKVLHFVKQWNVNSEHPYLPGVTIPWSSNLLAKSVPNPCLGISPKFLGLPQVHAIGLQYFLTPKIYFISSSFLNFCLWSDVSDPLSLIIIHEVKWQKNTSCPMGHILQCDKAICGRLGEWFGNNIFSLVQCLAIWFVYITEMESI